MPESTLHGRASRERLISELRAMAASQEKIRLLQVGACDGKNFDPAHAVLAELGMTSAVYVEPLAEYLVDLFSVKIGIPDLSVLNVAVSTYDGLAEIRYIDRQAIDDGVVPKWAMGISTIENGKNAMDGVKISRENFDILKPHIRDRVVPVISTKTLLRLNSCAQSNVYLSDCEGHDAKIILDMDLERFHPKVMFFESMLMEADEVEKVAGKLAAAGFDLLDDGVDICAVRTEL